MSQISPVMRIVLVGAILLMAAWFTVLKPKDAAVAPEPPTPVATPAEPQSAAGKAKAKAEEARAKAEAGVGASGEAPTAGAPSVSTPSGTTTVTSSRVVDVAPLTAKETAGLPSDVREALKRRDVIVLGVLDETGKPWAPMADDDRRVRTELRRIKREGGKLAVKTVPLEDISRYDRLITSLDVSQSPTIVVIDSNRRGVALTGYVDRVTINQAVADARRVSTDRRIVATYLRRTNETCANMNTTFTRLSDPTVRGAEGYWVARLGAEQRRYRGAFSRIPAPKRYRGLKKQIVAAVRAGEVRLAAAVKAGDEGRARAALASPQDRPLAGVALERRFTEEGLTACSANRPR